MDQVHLREIELAFLADDEVAADHLRWCRRCRSTVDDYRWLQKEIAATLAVAAGVVPVPRPRWHQVQERLRAGQQRLAATWRLSAISSIVCLMLVLSSVLGTGIAAYTLLPEAACAPSPVAAIASGEDHVSTATPTPALSCEGADLSPTPALVLHPAPPESETVIRLP